MAVKRNAERDARILELRHTMTLTQIAHHMGVTVSTVGGVFFRADYPYKPRPQRVRAVTDAELGKAARRAGLTLKEIYALGQQARAAQ